MKTKKCSKCGKRKSLDKFYTQIKYGKPYIAAECKVCVISRTRKYYKEHLEKYQKANTRWHKNNPEKCQKIKAKWYKKNSEKCRKNSMEYQKNNPEKRRESRFKREYDITIQDFNQLLVNQQARCAICGTDNPAPFPNFCIDHNHETGKVRGLLCQKCNVLLGMAQDNPETCIKAAKYLRRK